MLTNGTFPASTRGARFIVLAAAALLSGCSATPAFSPAAIATGSAGPGATAPPATAEPFPSGTSGSVVGGRLAFQRSGDGGGIFTINADGTDERTILAGAFGTPKWSPSGEWIAFYAESDSGVSAALVRPGDSSYRELAPQLHGLNCGLAAWSPDGERLALECWDEEDPSQTGIWMVDPAGRTWTRITSGHGLPGQFSPDGGQLLFAFDAGPDALELRIVDVDGSHEHPLGNLHIGQMPGFVGDGATIYAVADGRIVLLDMSGAPVRAIEAPERKIREARLSPDGGVFAFIYDPIAAVSPGLYRIGLDGGGFARIVHTDIAGVQEEHPDWLP